MKTRLYIISVALGILVTATGAWTTVVIRGTDITTNKNDIASIKEDVKEKHTAQQVKNYHLEESSHACDKIQGQILVRQEGMAEDIKAIRDAITVIAKKEFGSSP